MAARGDLRSGAPLVVLAPHLDDAVLSCGRALGAHPGSEVVTILAGGRHDWSAVTEWDRACGFAAGVDVIAARKAEDLAALKVVGATPRWIDALQFTYRDAALDVAGLAQQVTAVLVASGAAVVLMPLGLYHPDHIEVADLVRSAAQRLEGVQRVLYADLPYAHDDPAATDARVGRLAEVGWRLVPMTLPSSSRWKKYRAARRYRTQWRGLGRGALRRVVVAQERYWAATPPP